MRTATAWVDFTESIERPVRYCFPLPIPNPSKSAMCPTKVFRVNIIFYMWSLHWNWRGYIFGKNLVQVKRFIRNKKMEDILSFYYGKFTKSGKYQRWTGFRKMKAGNAFMDREFSLDQVFSFFRQIFSLKLGSSKIYTSQRLSLPLHVQTKLHL